MKLNEIRSPACSVSDCPMYGKCATAFQCMRESNMGSLLGVFYNLNLLDKGSYLLYDYVGYKIKVGNKSLYV